MQFLPYNSLKPDRNMSTRRFERHNNPVYVQSESRGVIAMAMRTAELIYSMNQHPLVASDRVDVRAAT